MKSRMRHPSEGNPERGSVLVVVAVSTVALLGFAALVVDLGWAYVNRNQLQNISDASALAATRELGHRYQLLSPQEQATFKCDGTCPAEIRAVARAVAEKNWAGGVSVSLLDSDIRIGQWDEGVFTETESLPDAVEVTSRRDESINTPIPTFFARVLGIEDMSVVAIATAAMTGQGTTGEGELLFPVTLSEYFFEALPDEDRCNDEIVFHPANDPLSCGGWTTWDNKSNAAILRKILDGDEVSPPMTANDSRIWTTGGDVASAFSNMIELYKRMGCASTGGDPEFRQALTNGNGAETCITWDQAIRYGEGLDGGCCDGETSLVPFLDEYGNPGYWPDPKTGKPDLDSPRYQHIWRTSVPVYDYAEGGADACANPGARTKWLVVGFAPVVITDVIDSPDKTVVGRVICDQVSPLDNRGGGGDFGVKGPIPGLVR